MTVFVRALTLFLLVINWVRAQKRVVIEEHSHGFEKHLLAQRARGWEFSTPPDPLSKIELVVAVKQRNVDLLEEQLLATSDPHARTTYGYHLTNDAIHELVAPSLTSTTNVQRWFADHGIMSKWLTSNGDFIGASVTVSQAEKMLGVKYMTYIHAETSTTAVRVTAQYTVPVSVAGSIDFVAPTVNFPPIVQRTLPQDRSQGLVRITPSWLRKQYALSDADVGKGAASNNSQAVASFIGQYYAKSDLSAFWEKYPPLVPTPVEDVPKTQPHAPIGTEAALDTEYLPSLGMGISTQVWYTNGTQPGNSANEPFACEALGFKTLTLRHTCNFLKLAGNFLFSQVAWLIKLATTPDAEAPDVFSVSYGDEEGGVTRSYALRSNTEFAKAGARGISLLAASGDSGAGCSSLGFVPTFPASSPYITAVGGLSGGGRNGGDGTEHVSVWASGGGGFSNYFTRPEYQDVAIEAYLKNNQLPKRQTWNKTGAGFPDVAAHAMDFDVCSDGFFYPIAGTSAASPTVAGIIATLNQARVDAGQSKLGFLNPLIYAASTQAGFTDITDGTNNFCGEPTAFPAAKGWDAASGWGAPDFAKLKALVLSLPRGGARVQSVGHMRDN